MAGLGLCCREQEDALELACDAAGLGKSDGNGTLIQNEICAGFREKGLCDESIVKCHNLSGRKMQHGFCLYRLFLSNESNPL